MVELTNSIISKYGLKTKFKKKELKNWKRERLKLFIYECNYFKKERDRHTHVFQLLMEFSQRWLKWMNY